WSTIARVRRALVEDGLDAALYPKPRPPRLPTKLDGANEAHLIALVCGAPPAGHERWTLRLLAERFGTLDGESGSDETGRRRAKKTRLQPWLKEMWCIPPERNAEFVAAMEDVLDVYQRPPDPRRPLVGMDEASKQLVKETRPAQPAHPGQPRRYDAEYERAG